MTADGKSADLSLRPATPEDRFRIRRWLGDPSAAEAWGNAASAEAEINLAMGGGAALCRIVERAGVAIGYAHAIEIGLLGGAWPEGLPPGTWHLNFLIAATEQQPGRLKGDVLAQLVREVFTSTLAVACSGVVSIRIEALARTYERAGFHWQRIFEDRLLGPSWLMLIERPK
jgi:aminoglycoside 6'-N-acetyltransferase